MKKIFLISLTLTALIACKKEEPVIEPDKYRSVIYQANFSQQTDFAFKCQDADVYNNYSDTIYNTKSFVYTSSTKIQDNTGNIWAEACIIRPEHKSGVVSFTIMAIDNGDTVKSLHLPGYDCYGFN